MSMGLKLLKIKMICLVLAGLVSCEKKEILVGFAGELTGINRHLGVNGRNGAMLALEEVNARGGVGGRELKLVVKDDQGHPQGALEADLALMESGVAAIIGHMTSAQTMAVVPLVNAKKMVLLSPTTSTPDLTGKDDYFFRVQGSSGHSAEALGEFAAGQIRLKNILIVRDVSNNAYTGPFKQAFLTGFLKDHTAGFHEITFSCDKDTNWCPEFEGIDASGFDGIFTIAAPRSTAAIIKILKKKNSALVFLSSSWGATTSLIMHGGRAVEGVYFSRSGVVNRSLAAYAAFSEKYRHRFGKSPSFAADHGYHALKLLARALEVTQGKSQGLKQALLGIKTYEYFLGGRGFDAFGDSYINAAVYKIVDGKSVQITAMGELDL